MRRQVNTAQEKITRLQRHQATKRETVEMKLAKLREEYNAIADERSNQQTKIDENRRIVEDMEKKVRIRVFLSPLSRRATNARFNQHFSIDR